MHLKVQGVIVEELDELYGQGLSHPLLGGLLDAGSYAQVVDLAASPPALEQLLGSELERVTKAAGVAVRRTADGTGAEGELHVLAEPVDLTQETGADLTWHDTKWHEDLAAGLALSFVLTDARGSRSPLWVLCGYDIPSMGPLASCTRDDVWATWLKLVGGSPAAGRSLLEEPPTELDPEDGAELLDRLQQLYGE